MSIYFQLKKFDLINWSTLLIGFEKELISKQEIEDYAIYILKKSDNFAPEIALLASAQNYNEYEIKDMITNQLNSNKLAMDLELDKLKLAALLSLDESRISEEEKCKKLQELYATFDYPHDMSECSIYSVTSKSSPLEAMRSLIIYLKQKHQIN